MIASLSLKNKLMSIIPLILLVFAVVLLVLIVAGVPVSQKVLNILFLIMIVLLCFNGIGYLNYKV
jgi:hypothetical protein